MSRRMNGVEMGASLAHFDCNSGNWLERLIFNNRAVVVCLCVLLTAVLGWQARELEVNASFEKMMPQSNAYIKNYLDNAYSLRGLGNSLRVVVENTDGDIYDPTYLQTLQKVSDTLFLMRGSDRSFVRSLWTPNVRWVEITEEGFRGGPVMPDDYDGSMESMGKLRRNVMQSGIVGSIVATDQRSSMVIVPLLETDTVTGKPLDYQAIANTLENNVRSLQSGKIRIHIIGFAKLAGDLISGLGTVIDFFALAALITAAIILAYTRCWRSTVIVLCCSMIAVIWQLGIIRLLGYVLDPYTVLVPFLVFAIGVSHGAQKMNGIMQNIGRGAHRYVAARYTFRRLFLAGSMALTADVAGFAVLMLIDIPVIKALALTASIGVALLLLTNLLLIPVLLSFVGVSEKAARESIISDDEAKRGRGVFGRLAQGLCRFTRRKYAITALFVGAILFVVGMLVSVHLQIGDLDPDAPELRVDSRYNKDAAYVGAHYALSSDQFVVIVRTPPAGIETYETLIEMDRLEEILRDVEGVQSVTSAADAVRMSTSANYEGNPKWVTISRDPLVTGDVFAQVVTNTPELCNLNRSVAPIIVYLRDHKAAILSRVVHEVEEFSRNHSTSDRQFLLAAGTAGIEAATNISVEKANRQMLLLLYLAVAVLCMITFRNVRAVLVALIPLMMTSVLCEALMVVLGIGMKVATLPVVALGVGIGVDYALYLLALQLSFQRRGYSLTQAYRETVNFTGKVVGLVGITLASGVITWMLSPIKFQADMGILLTFMFIWNMLSALILIPALSHFLLNRPRQMAPL